MSIRRSSLLAAVGISLLALSACGGGGGGDDFLGAASVSMEASPGTIDTGDRSLVTIAVSQVHERGIALKVLVPLGLEYVLDSSRLEVNEVELDASPDVTATTDQGTFLVYFLSHAIFGKDEEGVLTLELEGRDEVKEQEVEVDPDVDDPKIDNSIEFDPENPEFGAEASAGIEVTE